MLVGVGTVLNSGLLPRGVHKLVVGSSRGEPQLSPDGSLDGLKSRFGEVLNGIRKDYL